MVNYTSPMLFDVFLRECPTDTTRSTSKPCIVNNPTISNRNPKEIDSAGAFAVKLPYI